MRAGAVRKRIPWRKMSSSQEGRIFLAGVCLVGLYLLGVALTPLFSDGRVYPLLTMTGLHIIFGRAAGMSWGYAHDLPSWAVIVANMAIETFLVLLFYPLFVFSYKRFIVVGPLKDFLARARQAAQSHHRTIVRFGIPGLFLFVWFPFWMTGPLVGSLIGFLIGLRPWVNLSVVLAGTYVAIICWGAALQHLYETLEGLGPYVPFAFVGAVLLVAVAIHVRMAFSAPSPPPEGDQTGPDQDHEAQ
jgi:uncharacterized membrane protein